MNKRVNNGLVLLEVLVSVLIAGLVVFVISVSLKNSISLVAKSSEKLDNYILETKYKSYLLYSQEINNGEGFEIASVINNESSKYELIEINSNNLSSSVLVINRKIKEKNNR